MHHFLRELLELCGLYEVTKFHQPRKLFNLTLETMSQSRDEKNYHFKTGNLIGKWNIRSTHALITGQGETYIVTHAKTKAEGF